jgi:protein-tyrosine-phosphatase/predicted ATP-grasp superfamily ATP-dependent carboligase
MDVLVTSGQTCTGLNVARSLGRAGLRVLLGGSTPASPAFASRYVGGHFVYPSPDRSPEAFVEAVAWEVARWRPKLVVPADESSLAVLALAATRFDGQTKVAAPPFPVVRQVLDKGECLALAATLGVPTPRTVRLVRERPLGPQLDGLLFPAILMPTLKAVDGEQDHGKMRTSRNLAELLRHLARVREDEDWPVIQEYVPGVGVGIGVLAGGGEPMALFQYRHLRDLSSGGISVLRMAEPLNPLLADLATRPLRALGWDGLATVEFRVDRQGDPVLTEVNGGIWGGLALALAAGMDFPLWLYRYLVHGEVPPPPRYASGVRCRWLVGDVQRLEHLLRRDPPGDPTDRPGRLRAAWDFLAGFFAARHYDEFLFGDFRPGLRDLRQCLVARPGVALRHRVRERLAAARGRAHVSAVRRARRRGTLERLRRRALPARCRSILFVCHGNICRSPFAARYLQARLQALGRMATKVRSAGLGAAPGREADAVAARVAKDLGVDLSGHRAQAVSRELVQQSDLIAVMEWEQRARLLEGYPEAAAKTVLLGVFDDDPEDDELSIMDPYGALPPAYEACDRRIMACADRLLAHLLLATDGQ